MSKYLVLRNVSYEGTHESEYDSIEDVIKYIVKTKRYGDLGDYTIIEDPQYIDVYNLMEE